jgi:hypothetical protein
MSAAERRQGGAIPRPKTFVSYIRELVREELAVVLATVFGNTKPKRRGKWRPGGPGRPPKAVAAQRKRSEGRKRRKK